MQLDLFQTLGSLGIAVDSSTPIVIVIADGKSFRLPSTGRRLSPAKSCDTPPGASAIGFFDLLTSGGLGAVAALPALSEDLYAWYRLWCDRVDLEPLIKPQFISALVRAGRIVTRRKRLEASANLHGKQLAVAYQFGRKSGFELERVALTAQVISFKDAFLAFSAK